MRGCVVVACLTTGCAVDVTDESVAALAVPKAGEVTVTLTHTKSYNPSTWNPPDGDAAATGFLRAWPVPGAVSATAGAAGTGWVTVYFYDNFVSTRCCYQGRGGATYHFQRCGKEDTRCDRPNSGTNLALHPGDDALGDALRLFLHNGDSSAGPTQVSVTLKGSVVFP